MSTTENIHIVLNGPKDWDEWYGMIVRFAKSRNIFPNIDITIPPEDHPELEEPAMPQPRHFRAPDTPNTQGTTDTLQSENAYQYDLCLLSPPELKSFKMAWKMWEYRMTEFHEKQRALHSLGMEMRASIKNFLRLFYAPKDGPYEILRKLQRNCEATERERRDIAVRDEEILERGLRAAGLHVVRDRINRRPLYSEKYSEK
ncbi:uncharacterized protein BP5553_00563 [Venustampulla echinocandica]|uniref:Uncharacterized protein n=1 Tax=Venustampulla echinocandica TaxID=2656787 RepID=A0A370TYJ3_9HELO|nr:uncharacterized protein BP5553_00563 [Venustampulla echinocandica]RDL40584.1 hypothetical protein BP5553_00563 [Venustampulla echinocandica]